MVTSAWLAGCGRLGFGELDEDPATPLPDAPVIPDAVIVDAPPDAVIDSPVLPGPPSAKLVFDTPPMTTVCGDGTTTVMATVSNPGDGELVINGMTVVGTSFQVTAVYPLVVAPQTSVKVPIDVLPAVIGTDIGGTIKKEQLMIDANIPTDPVELATTVMGANVTITAPRPPTLAFSDSSGLCPAQKPATIKNTGNLPAEVTVVMPGEFVIAGSSNASVAPGAAMTRNFRPFTSSACSGSAVIEYEVAGPSCGSSGVVAATLSATFNITGTSFCFCS